MRLLHSVAEGRSKNDQGKAGYYSDNSSTIGKRNKKIEDREENIR